MAGKREAITRTLASVTVKAAAEPVDFGPATHIPIGTGSRIPRDTGTVEADAARLQWVANRLSASYAVGHGQPLAEDTLAALRSLARATA